MVDSFSGGGVNDQFSLNGLMDFGCKAMKAPGLF
jgi:hypothetical protein